MLSDLIDPDHLNRFRLALYNLEGFDIQSRKWTIDQRNRVEEGLEDIENGRTLSNEKVWKKYGRKA